MTLADQATDPSRCPDTSLIVDLCKALRPDPRAALRHLLDCDDCQASVHALTRVHEAYDSESARAEALAERILREVELPKPQVQRREGRVGVPAPSGLSRWGIAAANSVMAAMAGFWGVLLVSSGSVNVGLQGAALAGVVTGLAAVVVPLVRPAEPRDPAF